MEPYPAWIQNLPEVDTPFAGMAGRLLASPNGQAVFFRAEEEVEVPPHAHGPQWGVVLTGRLHFTVSGETGVYGPGETYDVPDGAEHSAVLEAGTSVIDFFGDADRYSPK